MFKYPFVVVANFQQDANDNKKQLNFMLWHNLTFNL